MALFLERNNAICISKWLVISEESCSKIVINLHAHINTHFQLVSCFLTSQMEILYVVYIICVVLSTHFRTEKQCESLF